MTKENSNNKSKEVGPEKGRHRLPKRERLCSKKQIGLIFSKGNSFVEFPFLFIRHDAEECHSVPVQVLFTVSKRNIKKACHRNLIRRRMKEVYRTQKLLLTGQLLADQKAILLSIGFIGKEIPDFESVLEKLKSGLTRLAKEISNRPSPKRE